MPAARRRLEPGQTARASGPAPLRRLDELASLANLASPELRRLAARDFVAWSSVDLAELDPEHWPQRAAEHAETLKAAAQSLTKTKPELARTAGRMNAELGRDQLGNYLADIRAARDFFESCAAVLTTVESRFLTALTDAIGPAAESTPESAPERQAPGAADAPARVRDLVKATAHQARPGTITALAAEWLHAFDDFGASIDRVDVASRTAWRLYPPRPPVEAGPEALALWDEQCAAINSGLGLPVLEERQAAASQLTDDLARRVVSSTPATVAEAALKLAIALDLEGADQLDGVAQLVSVVDDLSRLAAV